MTGTEKKSWVTIGFEVGQLLRFLSHAQTMSLFERACIRADIAIKYSSGFNPHPRLSLILPRPVGVESDDELFCVGLKREVFARDTESIRKRLFAQMPQGIVLKNVQVFDSKPSCVANKASYVFKLDALVLPEVKENISQFLSRQQYLITRSKAKQNRVKQVDIRPMVENIKIQDDEVIIDIVISQKGAPRIAELMQVLNISVNELKTSIKRTDVKWQMN